VIRLAIGGARTPTAVGNGAVRVVRKESAQRASAAQNGCGSAPWTAMITIVTGGNMRHLPGALLSVVITASIANPIEARAQMHPDRMTLCQDLAANALMYRGRLNRGASVRELQRQVHQMTPDQADRSMWASGTLLGAIDVASRRGGDLLALHQVVVATCEAQNPDGARVTVGLLRRYCGDLSNRAYMVALGRDAGKPRAQAEAEAFATTRPQFRSDAAAVVAMVYDEPRRLGPEVGLAVLNRCIRQPDIRFR
jgi:hypothetical protein